MPTFPVIVRFDLAAFIFCREHDNDANVLLPYDIPKVLRLVSVLKRERKRMFNTDGKGSWNGTLGGDVSLV